MGPWINTGQSVSLNKSDAVFGINLDLLRVGFTF